ncbi:MAG: major capsid protein [Cypionkella sp.]|nr:major capsid protein [Cypionkella sp.]
MLLFTNEQQAAINTNRSAFNRSQAAMAERHRIQPVGNGAFVGNASPLPKDVWGEWDREGIEVQRNVLSVFNDLAASVSVPMPIGKLVHYFQTISDSGQVNTSLDGRSKARLDQPKIDYFGTPVPILDSTFGFGWRQIEAARTEGVSLDVAAARNAMFKVAQQLELQTLNGNAAMVVGANPLYGLTNHPRRNTRSTGVALNAATGAQWVSEMNATLALLHADNFFVPATVYMNWATWRYAQATDYSTTLSPGKSIAQRIMEDPMIAAVVPASNVAANTILAVVKNRSTVQVLNAMPMTTRAQFRANPEDDYNFVTMAAAALEIKFDANQNCGIAHSS